MKTEIYTLRDGSSIEIPIPTCYKDCIVLLKSDYYRICGHSDSLLKIWMKSFRERSLKVLFWVRLASYKGWLYPICLLIHNHYKVKFDCRVHSSAKIGYGLYISHAMSMCVSVNCIIGNNVNLSQMINIGTNESAQAIIGDNVYIGPMTCIVEGVHIGKNSVIGAGSVVTRDVAADSTAVGVPAKVIGPNNHPNYVQNRWKNI